MAVTDMQMDCSVVAIIFTCAATVAVLTTGCDTVKPIVVSAGAESKVAVATPCVISGPVKPASKVDALPPNASRRAYLEAFAADQIALIDYVRELRAAQEGCK